MDEPREYTPEEVRAMFLTHLMGIARYWATTSLSAETIQHIAKLGLSESQWRCEGVIHSVLCVFDGVSGSMPAFDVVCEYSDEDVAYCKDVGDNWWPNRLSLFFDGRHLHDDPIVTGRKA